MKLLHKSLVIIILLQSSLFATTSSSAQKKSNTPNKILLGIDILEKKKFKLLKDKRVGLLTNPAGVNRDGKPTVQILHEAKNVNLVTLFGPEHGIYGDEKADIPVLDKTDTKTGLPVFSLYGKYRKPTKQMLKHIDVLVVDLQDIGARSYTYISCMKLAMEACFENKKEVIVLDRPNPLGGKKVAGPMLTKKWESYVGIFPMPYVHGLTIGEIALICKKAPNWLNISKRALKPGKLTVVPMEGWNRNMIWPETGLKWTATSPNIPTFSAVLGYSMTGLGAQIGGFRHGIGTNYPFRLLTFKDIPAATIKKSLEHKQIPGLQYKLVSFQDNRRKRQEGVYINISDYDKLQFTDLSFHMMQLACKFNKPNPFTTATEAEISLFNKHVGSATFWNELAQRGENARTGTYNKKSKEDARTFQKWSKQFWIYS